MTRVRQTGKIRLRSFREGDEDVIARLYTAYMAPFIGPAPVTPKAWRSMHRRQGWSSPSASDDPDCVRLALAGGEVVGYAVTHYRPDFEDDIAALHELCVEPGPNQEAVVEALISDAEQRARQRGKHAFLLALSREDERTTRAASSLGFRTAGDSGSVFMVAITNLPRFLKEIAPEMSRRLKASQSAEWEGSIALTSGDMKATLRLNRGAVSVAAGGARAGVRVKIEPEALPRLLLGQLTVGEAFLQDQLTVTAAERMQALSLLDALFPRVPLYLPRGQWW